MANRPTTRCPWTFKPLRNPAAGRSEHCGRDLPDGWAGSVTLCVAMAGARNSGKSFYIAVLVKQLEQLCARHNQPMTPATGETGRVYHRHYEQPLFEEMGLISSTPAAATPDAYQRDPLIFDIGTWPVDGEDRPCFLVIRDVAGEDLERVPEDGDDQDEALGFFPHADEIIFLFDPLKVPQVRTYLSGLVQVDELGGDPVDVLRNLLGVLRAGRAGGAPLPHLCVTMSKFDTLQELEKVQDNEWHLIMSNYGAAYRRDSGLDYSAVDARLLDDEIRSMLLRMGADHLINTIDRYYGAGTGNPRPRYCAVSALGAAPRGTHLDRSGIAPYRVLDPMLGLMARTGLIEPTKETP